MKHWVRFIRWVSTFLLARVITGEQGDPYMVRFRVLGWMPGDKRRWPFSVYLHWFLRADNEEPGVLHTHPWAWSFSLVLSGGYTEERGRVTPGGWYENRWFSRRVRPFRLNIFRAGDAHRIAQLHGEVWTLFVVGPKVASWGFLVPGRGFVPWRERCAERGIPT